MTAPIDLDHLNRYVFGDKALLAEILGIFKEQAASLSARMTPAMEDEAWHLAAHTLKGAARGVGAWALGDAAERAETLSGAASAPERAKALKKIVDLAQSAADYADRLANEAA
jgi:HPt (histidine-containing phosphotransfer) domain-containing protein